MMLSFGRASAGLRDSFENVSSLHSDLLGHDEAQRLNKHGRVRVFQLATVQGRRVGEPGWVLEDRKLQKWVWILNASVRAFMRLSRGNRLQTTKTDCVSLSGLLGGNPEACVRCGSDSSRSSLVIRDALTSDNPKPSPSSRREGKRRDLQLTVAAMLYFRSK
jgi:hypothetical protein